MAPPISSWRTPLLFSTLQIPCPHNTCSSFVSGPGSSVARRGQRKGDAAAGYAGYNRGFHATHSTTPGPSGALALAERSGMQAVEGEA